MAIKNILLVVDGHIRRAGVQTLLLDICKKVNAELYRFTWYFTGELLDTNFYKEVLKISDDVVWKQKKHGNHLSQYKQIVADINQILDAKTIDVIHVNSGLHMSNGLILLCANQRNVPIRISHAHGTSVKLVDGITFSKKIPVIIIRTLILANANVLISCSQCTADIVFGNSQKQYHLLKNGIDLKKFYYSKEIRKEVRRQLSIEDKFVVGTVARFSQVKNYPFLIQCFGCVAERWHDAKLMLVGDGELKADIGQLVESMNISEHVLFIGQTEEVNRYLQAMDVFVLPSFTEGLGTVNIEAQATGLPCIVSTGVPKEVEITECVERHPLSDGPEKWAGYILKYAKGYDRKSFWEQIKKNGYDIDETVRHLEKIYLQDQEVI